MSKKLVKINCKKCKIGKFRSNIVIGSGNIPADILFLDLAPDRSDDVSGRPLVQHIDLLAEMLQDTYDRLGIRSSLSYFVTNTVFCHPCDFISNEMKHRQPRDPNHSEIFNCTENVLKVVEQIKPKVTVFLNKTAEQYYQKELKPNVRIYHPAFLKRYGGIVSPYYLSNIRILEKAVRMLSEEYVF